MPSSKKGSGMRLPRGPSLRSIRILPTQPTGERLNSCSYPCTSPQACPDTGPPSASPAETSTALSRE
eukprot:7191752-Heterocapsa_arctica.AAC.1